MKLTPPFYHLSQHLFRHPPHLHLHLLHRGRHRKTPSSPPTYLHGHHPLRLYCLHQMALPMTMIMIEDCNRNSPPSLISSFCRPSTPSFTRTPIMSAYLNAANASLAPAWRQLTTQTQVNASNSVCMRLFITTSSFLKRSTHIHLLCHKLSYVLTNYRSLNAAAIVSSIVVSYNHSIQ